MLLMCVQTALAGAFTSADLPLTLTFAYAWDVPAVSGTVPFTFLPGTNRTETAACSASAACVDGRFTTTNGGTGRYTIDVQVERCVLRFEAFTTDGDRVRVPATCDVRQDLSLFYDGTSATYRGSAGFGTVVFERVFDCSAGADCPLEEDRDLVFRVVAEDFTGTLGGPGTGTFDET
jgi:hypothetical protein